MEEIKIGRYRHFKGNEYEVLYIAKNSENLEDMVVYQALYGERQVWVRPASMWNETVERDGKVYKRFTYMEEVDPEEMELLEKKVHTCCVFGSEESDSAITNEIPAKIHEMLDERSEDGSRKIRYVGFRLETSFDYAVGRFLSYLKKEEAYADVRLVCVTKRSKEEILQLPEKWQMILDACDKVVYGHGDPERHLLMHSGRALVYPGKDKALAERVQQITAEISSR